MERHPVRVAGQHDGDIGSIRQRKRFENKSFVVLVAVVNNGENSRTL
jgi:hypothetical protein